MPFINADLIGKALSASPAPDVLAQKIADLMREHYLEFPVSFATESVFSDEVGAKTAYLKKAAEMGFHVVLIAAWIPSAAASMIRVRQRVANGGHSVPEEKLPRRYAAGGRNLRDAFSFVETALVFDNSGPLEDGPKLAATMSKGGVTWKAKDIKRAIVEMLPSGPGAIS